MPQKHPLRWIIPIAYVASLDGLLALILLSSAFDPEGVGLFDQALGALTVVGGILLVANVVECIVLHATNAPYRRTFSRRVVLLMKIGLIPFFCLGGLVMAFLMVLSIHPVLAMIGWMGVPIAGAMGWAAMMSGSAWAIAYALGLYRDKLMSAGECVAHVLLQLFFFADVVDGIVLFVRGRAKEAKLWRKPYDQGGYDALRQEPLQAPPGQTPLGQMPPLQTPTGQTPLGQTPPLQTPSGQTPPLP